MAARKATKNAAKHYKEFFDHLANGIIEFGCRLLTIDANMSMWAVVPEMPARGFQICLAAWAPWQLDKDCGIFIIGRFEGIRYAFGAEAFKLKPADLDNENQITEFTKIPEFTKNGHGNKIRSYLPNSGKTLEQSTIKKKFLQWSLQPVRSWHDPSMEEIRDKVNSTSIFKKTKEMEWKHAIGEDTWSWPRLPRCTQKVLADHIWDREAEFRELGSWEPICVFPTIKPRAVLTNAM